MTGPNKYDDNFQHRQDAIDFFRKRDRVRTVDMKEASNARSRSLSWSCDGLMLAVGCENKTVYVGSLDSHYCRIKSVYTGYTDGHINSLKFCHLNSRIFATCSAADKTVRIWDTAFSKTNTIIGSKGQNHYVAWSPNDQYVVCISKNGSNSVVSAIDVRAQEVHFSAVFKEELFEHIFHPNGKYIFLAAENGKLVVLEFPSMQRHGVYQAHPPLSECMSLDISPDGKYLAIGGSDASCSLWDISDMMCVRVIDRPDYPVQCVSFSKCSNMLALGSEDANIDIGWIGDGSNEKVKEVPISTQCHDLEWNPKYYLLAYATAPDDRERESFTVRLFGSG